ncbi:hypothetical protein Kpho02_21080 [Kitasatospora phosalacinea]|uniref:Uncharacterized protein n=1 Tax=Kitasatospora phosalacinea TaxID=2065 RepID=A0A9W6Q4P5_9ACTN|nr:hypothetical protein [Kitasatospora phosalacinea]GLW69809.1 hypothetical protein Kpho02_21080 [Kitasatospora phosalacinea]
MTERGLSMRDPGPAALSRLVANMQRGDSHLVLERFGADEPEGDWYVQVRLQENGVYQVEYCDGVPTERYRTLTVSLAKVVDALVGWAAGRTAWRSEFDWTCVGHRGAEEGAGTGG